jgi:hypothetical protein
MKNRRAQARPDGSSHLGLVFFRVLRPQVVDFIARLLARVPVFDLEHGDELVELDFRLVHNGQVVIRHQFPPRRGLAPDRLPVFLKYRFIDHRVSLLNGFKVPPLRGAFLRIQFTPDNGGPPGFLFDPAVMLAHPFGRPLGFGLADGCIHLYLSLISDSGFF